jgi:superfamily II DNA or RNA helicase
MILDNQNKNLKIYEWIEQNIHNGTFDIVTGYFTIGALSYLSEKTNEKINEYRFIIGDIVSSPDQKVKSLDLLNENIDIESAHKLSMWAKDAVDFLKQSKVVCKTLEPNFCHAKLYLSKNEKNNPMLETYIMGSSNLTEAGLGIKNNQNIELNSAGTGTEPIYNELKDWFNNLWDSPKAHLKKTIIDTNGKEKSVDFKQYLIDEISKIFKLYEPIDIYHKILFELFNSDDDVDFLRDLGKLETSEIYKKLHVYQRLGAINLIKILNKYNGALLADAVGLGKTWTTLAIIKYYRMKGRKSILICPKKLEHNWKQYLHDQNSIFDSDDLNYTIHFHTDFTENSIEKGKINFDFINNEDPKLIVIDESHNMRNDKSIKYRILMDEILKKSKGDIKVLLLSATPINNNFKDVRNQFLLMTKGENNGFNDTLNVKNIEIAFRNLNSYFNKWNKETKHLKSFYKEVRSNDFFKLTENIVVARTRKQIKSQFDQDIHFPNVIKPLNVFETPMKMGDFDGFKDLEENLKLTLSAYQPTQFTLTKDELENKRKEKQEKEQKTNVTKDDVQREFFLVKMMNILLLKRLESSWKAFQITVQNIFTHHENALALIKEYKTTKKDIQIESLESIDDEELNEKLSSISLGKKNPISLKRIDEALRLEDFEKAILRDKDNLFLIKSNIDSFEKEFIINPALDTKLNRLVEIISNKQKESNRKLIIFTAYKDTAEYLFDQLKSYNFKKIGLVFGDEAISNYTDSKVRLEQILQQFAPYTKLFLEKKWQNFSNEKSKDNYNEWKIWMSINYQEYSFVLNNEIDILITTDVLSEGQNLQDADMVINYDIHWNPVRVIQRFGRIDRIGSPNEAIQCVNFWPASDIDKYINLKSRVEKRMAVMQFIGSAVIEDFTDEFKDMAENPMEDIQNANLLRQMKDKIEDLDGEGSLGFDDFTFDVYKQQLAKVFQEKRQELEHLPNGIFSGFEIEAKEQKGLIALLGINPKKQGKYTSYELVHLNEHGDVLSDNQKVVLEFLSEHRKSTRQVPKDIDAGKNEAIQNLQNILKKYVTLQNGEEGQAGEHHTDLLFNFFGGSKKVLEEIKTGNIQAEKKLDLITWMIVS